MSASNQFAVITGASSVIGYELATQFAQNGFDLLVAADNETIHSVAQELQSSGVSAEALKVDLASHEGTHQLQSTIEGAGRPLDAIAINAGVGFSGRFVETDLAQELNMVHLNVVSTLHLAKFVVKNMVGRGQGRILFTTSIAGTVPTPYETVYGATKAFVCSLSQGLREELKDSGVSVTVLMPGATETNFFHRAGADDTKLGVAEKDDPAEVASSCGSRRHEVGRGGERRPGRGRQGRF
jgi:short-subunit dehydrogenase